jgi:hypothetical protein
VERPPYFAFAVAFAVAVAFALVVACLFKQPKTLGCPILRSFIAKGGMYKLNPTAVVLAVAFALSLP